MREQKEAKKSRVYVAREPWGKSRGSEDRERTVASLTISCPSTFKSTQMNLVNDCIIITTQYRHSRYYYIINWGDQSGHMLVIKAKLITDMAYVFQGDVKSVEYPTWCYFIIAFLICASCICIPVVFLLRLYQRLTARRRRDTEIVRDLIESSTTKKPAQENAD